MSTVTLTYSNSKVAMCECRLIIIILYYPIKAAHKYNKQKAQPKYKTRIQI